MQLSKAHCLGASIDLAAPVAQAGVCNSRHPDTRVYARLAGVGCGLLMLLLAAFVVNAGEPTGTRRFDPRIARMSWFAPGPLVQMADGSLLTIGNNIARTSKDQGKTWTDLAPITDGKKPGVPVGGSAVLVRTRDGALVLVYMDMDTFNPDWDRVRGEPGPNSRLEVWSVRSLDGGRTWLDRHKIMNGYCGALINIIETRDGHIVVPVSYTVGKPGRSVSYTFVSADRGRSWRQSNRIDMGGHGDHDGACEGSVVELSDGRVMLLMRTCYDRFWQAFSDDHGEHWLTIQPSDISASSAPPNLLRLSDGRIVLFWNRMYETGKRTAMRLHKPFAHRPASWHRTELSMAFTEDDGRTWSDPVVIGRDPPVGLSYTAGLEYKPGHLWLAIHLAEPPETIGLRLADFATAGAGVQASSTRAK